LPDLTFGMATAENAEAVLAFSAEHGFTRRSIESWAGEHMDAAMAYNGKELVGAIPFARRSLQAASQAPLECGYLSGVVIRDDYRGAGLGSKLLQYLVNSYPVDGFMVNSFLDDAAYRWYIRNGFSVAVEVRSVMRQEIEEPPELPDACRIVEITDSALSATQSERLRRAFGERFALAGGFEVRDATFWNQRLRYHFYRAFNRYFLLSARDDAAYAIVSLNAHPSASGQIDVLELCSDDGRDSAEILTATRRLAADLGTRAIRFAVVVGSRLETALDLAGFRESGRFDILFRATPRRQVDTSAWTFFMWDYA
jgi:GNAT superfamily N-acetyltransferase